MQLRTVSLVLVGVSLCLFIGALTANQMGYKLAFKIFFYLCALTILVNFFVAGRFVIRCNRRAHERLKDGKLIFTDSLIRDESNKKKNDNV